ITTGTFIEGNMSTGMRATLLTPSTKTMRQATMIRYGVRMAKPDMQLVPLREWSAGSAGSRQTGLYFLSVMKFGMVAGNDDVAWIRSGEDLDILRRLDAGVYFLCPHYTITTDKEEPLVVSRAIDGPGGNRTGIGGLCRTQSYLGIHSGNQRQLGVLDIDLRSHRPCRHL